MVWKKLYSTVLFTVFYLFAQAQDSYYVDVDISNTNPSLSEQVELTYQLKFKGGSGSFNLSGIQIKKPSIPDFDILDEQAGMNMNMSFGWGMQGDMSLYEYQLTLQPKKAGTFVIQPVEFIWNRKSYKSPQVTITVRNAGTPPSHSQQSAQNLSNSDLFVRTLVNKTRVWQGEQISVTHKLFSKLNLAKLGDIKFPAYNGFWSEEIKGSQIQVKTETFNGQTYYTAELKKTILIPQKSGNLTIEPMTVECVVQVVKTRKARDWAEQMMYGNVIRYYDNAVHTIKSEPVSINVLPLPEKDKPTDFNGAVGSFTIKAEITKSTLVANDASNLKITVSGSGNLRLIEAPELKLPPDIETYSPKELNNITNTGSVITGSKTFDYLLIPRSPGHFTIKPIAFSFFDPSNASYKTLFTPEFSLDVKKGDGNNANITISGVTQEDIKYLNSDIRYINTNPAHLLRIHKVFLFSDSFFIFLALIVLIFTLFLILLRRNIKIQSDEKLLRNRKALKQARKRLKMADTYLKNNNTNAFYTELSQALWGFISDKLNIPPAELSLQSIYKIMLENKMDEQLTKQLIDIIDTCEFARFAPGNHQMQMKQLYDHALQAILQTERSLKISKTSNYIAKTLLFLLLIFFEAKAFTANNEIVQKANLAFQNKQYELADSLYHSLLHSGIKNDDLYYNLGNTAFRLNKIPQAILWYERALKLNPGNKDVAFNLHIANRRIADKINVIPEFFLKKAWKKVVFAFSTNTWALLILVNLTFLLFFIALFLIGKTAALKKLSFTLASIMLIFVIISFSAANSHYKIQNDTSNAVIISPTVMVKSSPDNSSPDIFVIHEGLKVRLLDKIGEWYKIRIPDGSQGWIKAQQFEII